MNQAVRSWLLAQMLLAQPTTADVKALSDSERVKPEPEPTFEVFDHGVRVGISASVQLDIIHDFNALGLETDSPVPREFITSLIPVGGSASSRRNRTAFSPNQSELILWAASETRFGTAKALLDFNLAESVSDVEFQVYRVWGHLGPMRFGLDYTQFLNQAAIPATLDFEGPQALPEARYAQASLRFPLASIRSSEKNLFLQLSVEDADAELTLPSNHAVNDISAVNQVPAVVAKFIYETDRANVQLAGIYRRLRAEGNGYDSSIDGWGLNLSGYFELWGDDNLMAGIVGGEGISALVNDTAGLDLDAAPASTTDSSLEAVGLLGVWAAFQHAWSPTLNSTLSASFLRTYSGFIDRAFGPKQAESGEFLGIYEKTVYSSANLVWSPLKWVDTGVEYLFGYQRVAEGTSSFGNDGYDHRIQVTFRLNFDYSR